VGRRANRRPGALARISAVDLICTGFASLPEEEQDEALVRLRDIQLIRMAEAEGEAALFLRALRRVAELNGGELTPGVYKRTREALLSEGEELPYLSRVIRHYETWARAKEAAALSDTATVALIEARFRARLRGHRPHFQEEELRRAMEACARELGRPPLLAEYQEWRVKELALAQARGELGRVPGAESFRRRFGGWEKALLACGFSPDELYVRLEAPERRPRLAKIARYSDDTLGEVLNRCVRDLGGVPLVHEFSAWRADELRRTAGSAIGLPTDSPYRRRFGSWEGALRHFGFSEAAIRARLAPGRARRGAAIGERPAAGP
jgi:hypothetical protein